ncbi:MAG: hypothetical protein RSD57_00860 [Comamonas sp.]
MDYTRPNHIPTPQEIAAAERTEQMWLIAFAALVVAMTIAATLVLGSRIS